MSTATPEQHIRSAANRIEREAGNSRAGALALVAEAVERIGVACVVDAATGGLAGTKDVAEALGIKTTNVGVERGLSPIARISDGRPVYARRDVERRRRERAEARAAREAAKAEE
jgi:poly-gamma-glutamate capsule biosynthesis protein CapA/YwtB (metallophosphatase superfamily)